MSTPDYVAEIQLEKVYFQATLDHLHSPHEWDYKVGYRHLLIYHIYYYTNKIFSICYKLYYVDTNKIEVHVLSINKLINNILEEHGINYSGT